MGTYVGNTLVAGATFNPTLLDFKWADHILNDISWLRADTFSWQPGRVYEAVYNHLINDLTDGVVAELYGWGNNLYTTSLTPAVGDPVYVSGMYGISGFWFINATVYSYDSQNNTMQAELLNGTLLAFTSRNSANDTENARVIKTRQSETIAGVTVQFFLADDGHKICPASEENNVTTIYTDKGVAWYYIIDTTNQRFKLPRTKFAFTGLRDIVGKYVEPELPNITGTFNIRRNNNGNTMTTTGAFSYSNYGDGNSHYFGNNNTSNGQLVSFNASSSNSIYKNNATVQPPATQMYLYFYVGNFTQTALENTAGVSTEILNDLNEHKVIAFQTPTAQNNYTWYRKYADGWVEQGGIVGTAAAADTTILLPVTMADTNYIWNLGFSYNDSASNPTWAAVSVWNQTTTSFQCRKSLIQRVWEVKGMAA